MKRFFDIVASLIGLLIFSPILLPILFLVWIQDCHSPFYIAPRVGKGGEEFSMIKLRSMVINADKSGVDSTSASDARITKVGAFIRRFKIDEVTQLWNVLMGDMSLVGPRPNVKRETDKYTDVEKKLFNIKPGITDFASVVFSDESEILDGKKDPDLAYNQLIRPWKSRLGLIYVNKSCFFLDFKLIMITIVALLNREASLKLVVKELKNLNVSPDIIEIAVRNINLQPTAPPGSEDIILK